MAVTPDAIPDNAMSVDHGRDSDHENYVLFKTAEETCWYTAYNDGRVQKETFDHQTTEFIEEDD